MRSTLLTLFSLLSLLLSSCSNTSHETSSTLNLPLAADPPTLDPRRLSDNTSMSVVNICFEGLTRMAPGEVATLAIAGGVEIPEDQKEYIFTLREAKWSNGWPVTAFDFEETFKTNLTPNFPSPNAYLMYIIKDAKKAKEGRLSVDEVGVEALDKRHLKITLRYPTPHFLKLLSSAVFFPYPNRIAHLIEKEGRVVGNGPYTLQGYRFGHSLSLKKSDTYWDAKSVSIPDIKMHIIGDCNASVSLYENGELDWVGFPLNNLDSDATSFLTDHPEFISHPTAGIYYYVFNTNEFPFNNAKLRKALSLAIDREAICEHITHEGQTPAYAFSLSDRRQLFGSKNIDEAKALFEEALIELKIRKEDLCIALTYNKTKKHHRIAHAILERWNKVFGIKTELVQKDWKVFLEDVHHKRFSVARMGEIANFSDPIAFLELFTSADNVGNYSGWSQPIFKTYLKKALEEINYENRLRWLNKAEEILINEMPIAPIYYYSDAYLKKPYLHGVYISPNGNIEIKNAKIDYDR